MVPMFSGYSVLTLDSVMAAHKAEEEAASRAWQPQKSPESRSEELIAGWCIVS
jgi:hypothetical protein